MSAEVVKQVAAREIRTRARTTAFKAITALLLVVSIAAPLAIAFWPENDDLTERTIGLTDPGEDFQELLTAAGDGVYDFTFELLEGADDAEVDAALENDDIDVVLDSTTLVWLSDPDPELGPLISVVFSQLSTLQTGEELGLSDAELTELLAPAELSERLVEGDEESQGINTAIGFIGLMAAFLLPQAFGQLTMMSVIEEKSTRVIEVLLSHIRPRTLLYGKIIGVTALALVQLLILIGGIAGALFATDSVDIPASTWRSVPLLMLSIIGGLIIYNTFFALLGSLISRQEDASQVMLPIFLPLMAGYMVGQFSVFDGANSIAAQILTYFPLTAPMLLPVSVSTESIGTLGIVLSLGSIALGSFVLLWAAAKLYEFTLLQSGTRIGWKKVWSLLRG